jgi:hypothetical protein
VSRRRKPDAVWERAGRGVALRSPDGSADHAVFQFDGVTLMHIEGGKITCQVASYDGLGFRAS